MCRPYFSHSLLWQWLLVLCLAFSFFFSLLLCYIFPCPHNTLSPFLSPSSLFLAMEQKPVEHATLCSGTHQSHQIFRTSTAAAAANNNNINNMKRSASELALEECMKRNMFSEPDFIDCETRDTPSFVEGLDGFFGDICATDLNSALKNRVSLSLTLNSKV